MHLEIDYREKDIIRLLEKEEHINQTVCNLAIGDFIIKKDDRIVFIIERKSIADLCASIVDGRWREQKARLIESIKDPKQIVYVIEGKYKDTSISKTTVNSAILNLIFKHQYKVVFTESKQDTVDHIMMLYNKVKEAKFELGLNVIQTMKLVKKSDKVHDNVFVYMLSVIPGVSANVATKVQGKYDTLSDLIVAYVQLESERERKDMLSELLVSSRRKVGKAVSEKIYNALHGKNTSIKTETPCLLN